MLNICFGIVLGSIITIFGVLVYFQYGKMLGNQKMKIKTCPYCGSKHIKFFGGKPGYPDKREDKNYFCPDCIVSFSEADSRFEEIRKELFGLLKGHDICNPVECEVLLEGEQGGSSLDMIVINRAYIDDYSEICFRLYGGVHFITFDDISLPNAESVLEEIRNKC